MRVYPMKIYLAGSLKHRLTLLNEIKPLIIEAGHEVTSRWLEGEQTDDSPETQREWAEKDWEDLRNAYAVVIYPEDSSSGGLHVELGLALGLDKTIFVVGISPNCFYYLPEVQFIESTDVLISYLKRW